MPKYAKWLGHVLLGFGLLIITACDAGKPSPSSVLCFTCTEMPCRPAATATACEFSDEQTRATLNAQFTSGEIDLTGDGVPEIIRRDGIKIHIKQEGIDVWETPSNWEVVDAALGDPNDDGRGELLLAFWRKDDEGTAQSHPFIIGYREGIYRTLWGGSAVRDAIHEVELGDLDGDGVQELVVLESYDEDTQTITVWRWHGWGFNLQWRSEPGAYSDLILVSEDAGFPANVRVTRVP